SSSENSQPLKYPDPDTEFSLFVFDIEYDGREYTYRYFDSETGMVTAEEYSVLIRLLKAPTDPDGVYALMFTEEFDLYEIRDFSLDVSPLSYRPDMKYIFAVPRGTE
ncbi:MAG: hypothetical protein IKM51_01365, partial [Oscillospiraceae bacterium]|nr:hypothetical protein [Oscillospiraceae bacterium]